MNIQNSFDATIQASSLKDAGVDVAELSLDLLIENELIKQIPIVKTFIGIIQAGVNVKDKLFLKKILTFLQGIDEIPHEKRKKIIEKIDASKEYRVKVGEKLLYIIDSCDDHTHSENIAKLFTAMLQDKISYRQFVEAAPIITRISQDDLDLFLRSHKVNYIDDGAAGLVHTGLLYTETAEVEVEIVKVEQANHKDPPEHYEANTHGGYTIAYPTSAGDTIFEVFGIGKEKREQEIKREREKQIEKLRQKNMHSGANI